MGMDNGRLFWQVLCFETLQDFKKKLQKNFRWIYLFFIFFFGPDCGHRTFNRGEEVKFRISASLSLHQNFGWQCRSCSKGAVVYPYGDVLRWHKPSASRWSLAGFVQPVSAGGRRWPLCMIFVGQNSLQYLGSSAITESERLGSGWFFGKAREHPVTQHITASSQRIRAQH